MMFRISGHPDRIDVVRGSIRVAFDWDRTTLLINDSDPELEDVEGRARFGESVSVRAVMVGAHFDADTGLPVFPAQYVYYRDQTFGPFVTKASWSWRVLTDEQTALLKGIGYHNAWNLNAALTEFDKGLKTGALRPAQRGLALALRAEAYDYKARAEPAAVGKDYLLVRASEAYEEAAKFRRDDLSLLTSRASVLVRLGAYEDALALLRPILKTSGEMHFRAGIMTAEVLRSLGRHAEALRVLDEVGERDEDILGMMYFYHRGWTLLLLDRNAEAAAAFSDGLKSQRSWPWVYMGRACASHSLGDDVAALSDLRTAVQFADRSAEREEEEARAVRAELRNNIAALERGIKPVGMSICQRFQPNFDGPLRERSKLLPAAAPLS